jgi:hypothetical protein
MARVNAGPSDLAAFISGRPGAKALPSINGAFFVGLKPHAPSGSRIRAIPTHRDRAAMNWAPGYDPLYAFSVEEIINGEVCGKGSKSGRWRLQKR